MRNVTKSLEIKKSNLYQSEIILQHFFAFFSTQNSPKSHFATRSDEENSRILFFYVRKNFERILSEKRSGRNKKKEGVKDKNMNELFVLRDDFADSNKSKRFICD